VKDVYLYLSENLDLEALKNLRQLGFVLPIPEKAKNVGILLDIAKVLSTIQTSNNRLETISLDVTARGESSWPATRAQDWAAVAQEAGRLSIGRGLLLEVKIRHDRDYGISGALADACRDLFAYIDKVFREALVPFGHVEYHSVHIMY
jgi:hypothetical protein